MPSKRPLSTKTKRIFRAVIRRLRKIPRRQYVQSDTGQWRIRRPECKSPACIIGHALNIVAGRNAKLREKIGVTYSNHCRAPYILRTLGLNLSQFESLFCYGSWPAKFHTRKRPGPALAIKRLEHFIATGE